MGIPEIIKNARGYLTVRIEGLNLEKFLNIAVAHSISFWDVKRLNMTILELKVSIRGYRSLKKVIKRTGSKLTITNKDGLPFFLLKLKRRKALGLGFVVFILLVFMLSSFIWSVNITGARTVSTEDIKKSLAELGVKPGALKLGIAVSEIENDMLIKMGSISWIKVKLKGTRAEIEVKERIVPPRLVPEDKPCSIVAKRDGVITKIASQKGDTLVIQGEPVKKGQMLVTGVIERLNVEPRYVHSTADIKARTWYEGKAAVPLESTSKVRNGNKLIKIYIAIGSKIIHVKNTSIPYKSYDKIVKSTKLIETDRFELPIEIAIEDYFETTSKTITMTAEEAKLIAEETVEKAIIDSIPPDAKIINRKINLSVKDGVVVANALIETIEDIGVQEEIKTDGED